MNNLHKKVLDQWDHSLDWGHTFKGVSNTTDLPIPQVRRIVRHLARKGYLIRMPFFDEDGYLRGSGYFITNLGIKKLKELYHE